MFTFADGAPDLCFVLFTDLIYDFFFCRMAFDACYAKEYRDESVKNNGFCSFFY